MSKKIAFRNIQIHQHVVKDINICPYCSKDEMKREVVVANMVTFRDEISIHGRCFRHRHIIAHTHADKVESLSKEEIAYLQVMTS